MPLPPLAVEDLEPLHHFITHAYATLGIRPESQRIWLDCVVLLGFKNPLVLQGHLSISALHLATLLPAQSQTCVAHALTQYDRKLATFRVALQNANSENYKAIYNFSYITVIHALAIAQVQKPEDPAGGLLGCMHLVQGVMVVLVPFLSELYSSEFGPMLRPDIFESDDVLPRCFQRGQNNATENALDLLHHLVCKAHADTVGEPYVHYMLCWHALLSSGFLQDLSRKDPVSMILLAHFAAVLSLKSKAENWFVARWSIHIFDAVESRLEPNLKEWLDWPRAVMEQGRIVLN
ncbi:hypothetical protein BJ875DRAFT_435881 [Amylocarpus encephaloides]|uniref:Uncharacterized protein n=1 Tax=Amylocarpus encephaloides TaxID=45428 RepID=A0A9P7Y7D4_9HELO|nr:hypothetical protein BJ875DRAFT_435881 [Amylocarpus encephaloides]